MSKYILDRGDSTQNRGYSLFIKGDLDDLRPKLTYIKHIDHGEFIEFSNSHLSELCDILVDEDVTTYNTSLAKRLAEVKAPVFKMLEEVTQPQFKLQPRPHQIDAVVYGLKKHRFLLGDVMGLGKTGNTIFLAEILKAYYGFKHVLIVCGINGAKYNWHMIEIPKFSYEQSHIVGSRINKAGRLVVGSVKERIEDIKTPHDEFYLIINVESLRNKEVTELLHDKIIKGEIGMVVIDEIHLVSGRSSEQGKAIHKLKPQFRVGLTGTPIHNRPLELYNLLVWLGYEQRNFEDFADEYTIKVPVTTVANNKIIDFFKYVYKDLSMLHDRLKSLMLRRGVEVLNLPEPIFMDEYVELDISQIKVYNKIKEELLNNGALNHLINVREFISNAGVAFIKARQVVSCPHIFGVKRDAKLERTIEIVEEQLDSEKSVVIFAWFNDTIDQYYRVLSDKFGKDKVIAVQKSTSNAQELVSEFQNSDKPMVLIGTIGKLGTAFTITRADMVIFVDKHVIWSDYKQAFMRVWRQGQTKTVVIVNILAKDTVDERLEELVSIGRSHHDQVVDGVATDEYLEKTYGKMEDLL